MSPASTRTKPISHSVSKSADSASYYVDGSIDQASPVKSHDFAAVKRSDMQAPSSPKSQHSYLNGQYDYESAVGPFSPSQNDAGPDNLRVSDSSSMFGTLSNKTLLENVQPPFSVDGTEREINAPASKGMPGSYQDTPKLSKTGSKGEKKKPIETSYFDADGEVKEGVGSQRDDVSIGEAF